jgi:hypothetical protein
VPATEKGVVHSDARRGIKSELDGTCTDPMWSRPVARQNVSHLGFSVGRDNGDKYGIGKDFLD